MQQRDASKILIDRAGVRAWNHDLGTWAVVHGRYLGRMLFGMFFFGKLIFLGYCGASSEVASLAWIWTSISCPLVILARLEAAFFSPMTRFSAVEAELILEASVLLCL